MLGGRLTLLLAHPSRRAWFLREESSHVHRTGSGIPGDDHPHGARAEAAEHRRLAARQPDETVIDAVGDWLRADSEPVSAPPGMILVLSWRGMARHARARAPRAALRPRERRREPPDRARDPPLPRAR